MHVGGKNKSASAPSHSQPRIQQPQYIQQAPIIGYRDVYNLPIQNTPSIATIAEAKSIPLEFNQVNGQNNGQNNPTVPLIYHRSHNYGLGQQLNSVQNSIPLEFNQTNGQTKTDSETQTKPNINKHDMMTHPLERLISASPTPMVKQKKSDKEDDTGHNTPGAYANSFNGFPLPQSIFQQDNPASLIHPAPSAVTPIQAQLENAIQAQAAPTNLPVAEEHLPEVQGRMTEDSLRAIMKTGFDNIKVKLTKSKMEPYYDEYVSPPDPNNPKQYPRYDIMIDNLRAKLNINNAPPIPEKYRKKPKKTS